MKEKIAAALAKLDVANDNHWTAEGLPRVETVRMLASDPSIQRETISTEFPDFTRATASGAAQQSSQPPAPPEAPAAPQPPAPPAAPTQPDAAAPAAAAPDTAVLQPQEQAPAAPAAASLKEQLEEAQKHLEEIRVGKRRVDQMFADQQNLVDKLQTELDRERQKNSKHETTHVIQGYLAAQQAEREKRGEAWAKFDATGVKIEDILPRKAPIDAMLAQRNRPGQRRG